ncbi:MAG: tetratricopeptide repeat protein [Alphaproteobacteria bacterium]
MHKPDPKAAALHDEGRREFLKFTPSGNARAQDLFRQAFTADPKFARAHGHLAYAQIVAWRHGFANAKDSDVADALGHAREAVGLDPSDYDNHWSLGAALVYNGFHEDGLSAYEEALASYALATEKDPVDYFTDLLVEMAETLILCGRPADGVRQVRRAKRINPAHRAHYDWVLGWACLFAGRYVEALEALTARPSPPPIVVLDTVVALVRLGRMDEARSRVNALRGRRPSLSTKNDAGRWPFRDREADRAYRADLMAAGVPE